MVREVKLELIQGARSEEPKTDGDSINAAGIVPSGFVSEEKNGMEMRVCCWDKSGSRSVMLQTLPSDFARPPFRQLFSSGREG
jgi:hypothetical protein